MYPPISEEKIPKKRQIEIQNFFIGCHKNQHSLKYYDKHQSLSQIADKFKISIPELKSIIYCNLKIT